MRRFLLLFAMLLIACQAVTLPLTTPPATSPTPSPALTATIPPAPSPSPEPVPSTSTAPPATAAPSPSPDHGGYTVRYHPDGPLYVGDLVSLEVLAPPGSGGEGLNVTVQVNPPQGETFETVEFGRFGIGRRSQATLQWVWDTSSLHPGPYDLSFTISPSGFHFTDTVMLQPESEVPPPEPQAHWVVAESDCCLIYYVTGTAAERDLEALLEMADDRAFNAAGHLAGDFEEPIQIVFLPRVLGHGGFASAEISVSYLDRNYAGSSTELVLHHEMVHILDARLGGDLRPTLFVEGLAVYLTGGHFKPELLIPRAAALLPPEEGCAPPAYVAPAADAPAKDASESAAAGLESGPVCGLDRYLPLAPLLDDFYNAQHEIGYLQAGALVEYMVERWGWDAFSNFYRSIVHHESGSQADSVEAALLEHFDLTITELESDFLLVLEAEPVLPEMAQDVALTVRYYDTVRLYQQLLDPSAYFLTAWLVGGQDMRERGIVADYLRRPTRLENLAFEVMLVAADNHLRSGDYAAVDLLLDAVAAALERFSQGSESPFDAHPLAADYFSLVGRLQASGYQPQQVEITQDGAHVLAGLAPPGAHVPDLVELNLVRVGSTWAIAEEAGN